jgi:hypothetical protein
MAPNGVNPIFGYEHFPYGQEWWHDGYTTQYLKCDRLWRRAVGLECM